MSLAVDIISASMSVPVARTRLHVTDVPGGVEWTVRGEADGHSWVAASGVSHGRGVWCTDPMAPLGMEATYWLEHGGATSDRSVVIRPFGRASVLLDLPWRTFRGWDLVTDLSGRRVVAFIRPHEHARTFPTRAHTLDVGRVPASRHARSGAPTTTLTARTTGEHTRVLEELVDSGEKLIVLHQRSPMGRDSVPLSQWVTVTSASDSLAARRDAEDRTWSLGLSPARPPWRYAAPVVTHRDVRDFWGTHRALVESGLTHAEIAKGDWMATRAGALYPRASLYPRIDLYPRSA